MSEPKMLTAIHPNTGKPITPKEFISEFGVNHKEEGIYATCMYCGANVFTYGTSSIEVTSRFKHFSGQSCDTSTAGGGEHPGFDLEKGRKFKEAFCTSDEIIKSYVLCLQIVGKGNFPIGTFLDLCKRADRKNIWSYVGVETWMIPYMLLTLNDITFTSQNNNTFQIRFVLDKTFNTFSKEKKCNLEKMYADSQNIIQAFEASLDNFQAVKIDWVNQAIKNKINSYYN